MKSKMTLEQKKIYHAVNRRLRNHEKEECNCCHGMRMKESKDKESIEKYGQFYLTHYGVIVSHHIVIEKFLAYQKEVIHLNGYNYFEDGWVVDDEGKLVRNDVSINN